MKIRDLIAGHFDKVTNDLKQSHDKITIFDTHLALRMVPGLSM